LHEAGPADFEMFKSMLADANRGQTGMPRIVVEGQKQPPPDDDDLPY
jgi:hypothetical protein